MLIENIQNIGLYLTIEFYTEKNAKNERETEMFGKKSPKKEVFMFNYVCREAEKCAAFSVSDGVIRAEWCDEEGNKHSLSGIAADEAFWKSLEKLTEENGVFGWKAYKVYSHFAFSLDTSVFNAEGVFPSGRCFAANNLHGEPKGFEEALDAYKAFFASLEE